MVAFRSAVSAILQEIFAPAAGNVRLDDDGIVTLEFHQAPNLTIEVPAGERRIYACAETRRACAGDIAVLQAALARNLFRTGAPGTWLALDAERDALVICGLLDEQGPPDIVRVETFLADFVHASRDLWLSFNQRELLDESSLSPSTDWAVLIRG